MYAVYDLLHKIYLPERYENSDDACRAKGQLTLSVPKGQRQALYNRQKFPRFMVFKVD